MIDFMLSYDNTRVYALEPVTQELVFSDPTPHSVFVPDFLWYKKRCPHNLLKRNQEDIILVWISIVIMLYSGNIALNFTFSDNAWRKNKTL